MPIIIMDSFNYMSQLPTVSWQVIIFDDHNITNSAWCQYNVTGWVSMWAYDMLSQ